jgi:hypothetical protein
LIECWRKAYYAIQKVSKGVVMQGANLALGQKIYRGGKKATDVLLGSTAPVCALIECWRKALSCLTVYIECCDANVVKLKYCRKRQYLLPFLLSIKMLSCRV